MARTRKPYVHRELNRHGKTCWYFRKGKGKRTRLPGAYESPEWLKKYAQCMAEAAKQEADPPEKHTFGWLCDRYMQSIEFRQLAQSTQASRRNMLTAIRNGPPGRPGAEHKLISTITKADINEGRDRRADTPHAAINFIKMLGYVFEWAVDNDLMTHNPARGVKRPKTRTEGFATWTDEDVGKFYSTHHEGSQARLAMDLLLFTGLRRGDVFQLGRKHIKGDVIEYQATKNDQIVYAPIDEEFRRELESLPDRETFIVTPIRSEPFKSAASFGNWFGEMCRESGVSARAHGLRKKRATDLAEHGNSNSELKALLGWRSDAMANLYTKKADRKRLALAGAARVKRKTYPLTSDAGNSEDDASD